MRVLIVTTDRPSLEPSRPLDRIAALLGYFPPRHAVTLACLNDETEPSSAWPWPEVKLVTAPASAVKPGLFKPVTTFLKRYNTFTRLKEAILAQPGSFELIQGDGLATYNLVADLVKASGVKGLVWARPGEIATDSSSDLQVLPANRVDNQPWLPDGIDLDYFRRNSPINILSQEVIFRLAPHDPAALEALAFMLEEIWPRVRELNSQARLLLATPAGSPLLSQVAGKLSSVFDETHGLSIIEGVTDLRPLYERCRLAVLPYLGSPADTKPILEAWAMQLPFVTMQPGADALPGAQIGDQYVRGEDPKSYSSLVARLLEIRGPGLHLAEFGRPLAESRYSWPLIVSQLETFWQQP
ncbi:MAG TPA: glycosyltransferase [Chloroflexia bacterium]|nr:glycosyltransferase [Chloroflexia bacterium]